MQRRDTRKEWKKYKCATQSHPSSAWCLYIVVVGYAPSLKAVQCGRRRRSFLSCRVCDCQVVSKEKRGEKERKESCLPLAILKGKDERRRKKRKRGVKNRKEEEGAYTHGTASVRVNADWILWALLVVAFVVVVVAVESGLVVDDDGSQVFSNERYARTDGLRSWQTDHRR